MLSTSKYVLFPGHNHLLTMGADDPSLIIAWAPVDSVFFCPVRVPTDVRFAIFLAS